MPHNHLQDALAYLHTLYATYEAQGITITGSRMPLTQYANFAAMKYLLFLANQDRVITDAETNFINNCLQQSATTQTMERFCSSSPFPFPVRQILYWHCWRHWCVSICRAAA